MTRPLASVRVVVTDPSGPGRTLSERLTSAGIVVVDLPVITHAPASDPDALHSALRELDEVDWLAFTSVRAVEAAAASPAWQSRADRRPSRPKVAAVGPMTRTALTSRGIAVDVCPETPGAATLAQAVIEAEGGSLAGRTVLWPRSNIARPEFGEILRRAGAKVRSPEAYRTLVARTPEADATVSEVLAGRFDCVTFLSPSAASGFADLLPGRTLEGLRGRTIVASVGPATTAALEALGATPTVESPGRTAGDLAASLLSYFGSSESPPP